MIKTWVRSIGVADHEASKMRFLWWLRFLYQIGFIWLWTVVVALFIDVFSLAHLPLFFVVDGALWFLGSLLSGYAFVRMGVNRFIFLIGCLMVLTLGSLIFVWNDGMAFFALAILVKSVFYMPLNTAIYRKNESHLSPCEAERLLPVLDTGITLGTITSALILLQAMEFLNLRELMVAAIIPVLLLLFLVGNEGRWLNAIPRFRFSAKLPQPELWHSIGAIRRHKFFQLATIMILLQGSIYALIELEFLRNVASHVKHEHHEFAWNTMTPNNLLQGDLLQANLLDSASKVVHGVAEKGSHYAHDAGEAIHKVSQNFFLQESLAHDLTMFSLLFGFIGLLIQLILTTKVLKRFGILRSMMIYIGGLMAMVGTALGMGLSFNWIRGYAHSSHSLFDVGYHLTYYSIFSHRREPVRHFLEGVIRPFGMVFGIVLIGGISLLLPQMWVTHALIVFLAILIGLVLYMMRREFSSISCENLRQGENVEAKLHSIEVLGQKGHIDSCQVMCDELRIVENHPVVRQKIINMMVKQQNPRVIPTFIDLLENPAEDSEVKMLVLEALLDLRDLKAYWGEHAFAQYRLVKVLKALLDITDHSHLQKLVVMNLFAHMPTNEMVPYFFELLESCDDVVVSICLRTSSEIIGDPSIKPYLEKFLNHKNPRLRGHAVIALWDCESKRKLRSVMKSLLQSDNKEALIAGIYGVGETKDGRLKNELIKYLAFSDKAIRLQALVAMAKLEEPKFLYGMVDFLFEADALWAQKALSMMQRAPKPMQNQLKEVIQHEVAKSVMLILKPHYYNINAVSRPLRERLKFFYTLAERYDEMVLLEKMV